MKNLIREFRTIENQYNKIDPFKPRTDKVESLNSARICAYKAIVSALYEKYPSGEVDGFWVTTHSSCAFFLDKAEAEIFSAKNYPYGAIVPGKISLCVDGFFWEDIVRLAEKIAA